MTTPFNRPLLAVAGLCGALGVALAAAGSHDADASFSTGGDFLLFHASALIGLSLIGGRLAIVAGGVLALAVLLFAGDLACLGQFGHSLFPGAAPIGGTGLMLGWLLVIATAVAAGRKAD